VRKFDLILIKILLKMACEFKSVVLYYKEEKLQHNEMKCWFKSELMGGTSMAHNEKGKYDNGITFHSL